MSESAGESRNGSDSALFTGENYAKKSSLEINQGDSSMTDSNPLHKVDSDEIYDAQTLHSSDLTHFSYTEEKMLKDEDAKLRLQNSFASTPLRHSSSKMSMGAAREGGRPRLPSFADFENPPPPPMSSGSKFVYNPTSNSINPSTAEEEADHDFKMARREIRLGGLLNNDHNLMDGPPDDELIKMYKNVETCLDIRDKYQAISLQRFNDNPKNRPDWNIYPPPPPPAWKSTSYSKEFDMEGLRRRPKVEFDISECDIPGVDETVNFQLDSNDVYQIVDSETGDNLVEIPTIRDYYIDLDRIVMMASDGPAKSFAFKRLEYLEARWNLYILLNEHEEISESKRNPHRDFYNVRKVDTHVHHSACMNQKHLLRFIKYKIRHCADEKVIIRDGSVLTLKEVFASLNLTAYDLSIDTLDMHAHRDTFHRFDKFNLKYNPIGESRLREIFLKTDNYIKGRYLAEVTSEVFEDLEASKYQMAEYRISIYGRDPKEWDKLAAWVVDNKLFSHNVRWLIQVPRLYDIYKTSNIVQSFQDVVKNIFEPLFAVTKDPSSNPKLHIFLQRVIGFDSVDDESKPERRYHKKFPTPRHWDASTNPPYSYYLYYLYANLASLNNWRQKRGFNTMVLRPHSGEAGDPEHLIAAYLTSEGISHGILLRKVPFIQYLYYLKQIGIAMSPLSNNALFLTYDKNPFPDYFRRGLNVSLSTDDPLQFSYTREPLIEEYSVATQIYKLSNVDLSELAKNSVMMSGFEYRLKRHWLGHNFDANGLESNDIEKTNVPDIRLQYRLETLQIELELIKRYSHLYD
ncbi:unnamed protein product [Kuraishia capsulata CBS 1993]|uniref:AMP deaminase n=1 Tax=Kuraishia capsulata CBS 1993 TaxID=1382522 RepID=W6MS22_9ASCO|nr:uncharacterized protein KUCA_T00000586001 [Kuraishia capsulata CBS 1993]CDK24620.1 unnamed protein product [Kuraishia capsulata CBS 1993]